MYPIIRNLACCAEECSRAGESAQEPSCAQDADFWSRTLQSENPLVFSAVNERHVQFRYVFAVMIGKKVCLYQLACCAGHVLGPFRILERLDTCV